MKKIIQAILIILIFLCIYIEIDYNRYMKDITKEENPIVDVVNGLSVNYLNGKNFKIKSNKTISFSITNFETESLSYRVKLTPSIADADISYELTSNEDERVNSVHKLESTTILDDMTINTYETQRYTLKISNKSGKTIDFELKVESLEYSQKFSETIISNNEIKNNPETGFEASALGTEGLIKNEDNGTSYYFRGNIINNYVSFADMTWRIVGINPDHSVKIILDNVIEFPSSYSPLPDTEESVNNTEAFKTLDDWYNTTLTNYDSYISVSPDCFDNSIFKDENGITEYLSDIRLLQDHLPSLKCSGTVISNKISLLSADEVNLAGASINPNESYYLYIPNLPNAWWTMTPNKKVNGVTSYFAVQNNGALIKDIPETNSHFLRPVISLNPKTKALGDGTKENPYVIID